MILYLDIESFCEVPIQNGTHAYAEAAEVMLVQWAIDDGPVQIHDFTEDELWPDELLTLMAFGEDLERVVMHTKDAFDRIVLQHNGVNIPSEMIHNTAVQALAHGLPAGLDKLCAIFNLPVDQAKDKAGKALIQLFCKPPGKHLKRERATRLTHPVEWERFKDYAKQDIVATRALYTKYLPRWNYPAREHDLWCLDQRINDRGFAVDLDLARGAIDTVNLAKKQKDAATEDLTNGDVRSTTQRDELLKHLLAEWGVDLPDCQAGTLERRVEDEDLPWPVRELLLIRLQVSQTSNAKYNTVLKAVSKDGRIRGSLQFCGAARTKRWSGKVFQPTNLPRPDMEQAEIDFGIEMMKTRSAHLFFDEPMHLASNAIRGIIVAGEDKKLVVSDLEQVEARTLPWLAGEHWKLADFRAYDAGEGHGLYELTASRLLGKPPEEIDRFERQSHGKVVELACGFGGSIGAFNQFARLYGVDLPEHQIHEIVRGWRELHPALCDWDTGLWAKLDEAARLATASPNRIFTAGEHIAFERWGNWLKMHLPSGGFLSYADPRILPDPRTGRDSLSYMGINNYTKRWERLYTYGGKLSADATQSTAREIMAGNLPAIEEAGYPPVLLVHDEVVTEPLDEIKFSVDKLNQLLATNPRWAPDLPLAAGGFEAYRYRKDG